MMAFECVVLKKDNVIYTIALNICCLVFGFSQSLIDAARLDIAELVNSNFEGVSYGLSVRSLGYVVVASLVGWIFTQINRQIGLTVSFLLASAFVFVVPFTRVLWIYLIMEAAYGCAISGIDIACNAWMLEIWQENANPYMQGMYLFLAIGTTIAPLIDEPFLSRRDRTTTTDSVTQETGTRIMIPYTICSLCLIAVAAVILLLYYLTPYTDPRREVATKHSTKEDRGSSRDTSSSGVIQEDQMSEADCLYHRKLVWLGCLLLLFYSGIEISTFSFLPEFVVVIGLSLSKSDAAFMSSVMSACYAVSRLLSIAVASKLETEMMLYAAFAMLGIGYAVMLMYANQSLTMLWMAIIIIGSGHSCIRPAIMSFLEERMNVTTTVCSFFMVSSFTSSIFMPILLGKLIESYPLIYVYVNLTALVLSIAIFGILALGTDRRSRSSPAAFP